MLILIFSLFHPTLSDPFGIDPSMSKRYQDAIDLSNNTFTCLDGSLVIPLSKLNDGSCDCPDNSDEPGTNACLNGHFYCKNIGGKPKLIPSIKVNDGVCDCCDGSDEFDNPNSQCPNICSDLVELSSKGRNKIYKNIEYGLIKKNQSLAKTQEDYKSDTIMLNELKKDLSLFEHELDILNRKKREKRKIWKIEKRQLKGITEEQHAEYKRRKNEYINKPKKVKETYFEPDVHGMNVPFDEDLGSIDWNVDEDIEELIFEATPRPLPVKRNSHYQEYDEQQGRIEKRKNKWKKLEKAEKENMKKAEEKAESKGFLNQAFSKIKELKSIIASDKPKSYEEYKKVEKEIEEMNIKNSETRNKMFAIERKLRFDLGKDNLWYPLAKERFELIDKNGNDYQINMFDNVMTRQHGASWYGTCCGTFKGFNETQKVMYYEEGSLCWEGSPRRTEVYLYCGPSNKFLDMEEVDRCVYRAHFETPLSCTDDYLDYIKNMSDIDLSEFISRWELVE